MPRDVAVVLTKAEAEALYGAARAGEYEWTEVTDHAPDLSPQAKVAAVKALERALQKLRDA